MLLPSVLCAQSDSNKHDRAARPLSVKRNESFFDYTLKRINPADIDYGSRWGQWRKAVVEETAKNRYFWSNVTAVGLLGYLFLIIVCQRNTQTRREWATAELLTQYSHALIRANAQILDLTSKNHDLANAATNAREQAIHPLLPPNESPAMGELARPPKFQITPSKTAASTDSARTPSRVQPTEAGKQIALFTPEVDLMMTVNSLKQQLAHSEERNTLLQRRMAATSGDRDPRQKPRGPKHVDENSTSKA
jgi:hypothetical protein